MEQQELIAGDTLNFATTTPGYSAADGWVLKYRLIPRSPGGAAIELTSTQDGDDHRVQVAATTTAGWVPDTYGWGAWVERSGEKYSLQSGQIVVKPDPRSAAAGTDLRSMARKALDDARAAFAAWTPTKRRYRIADREMEFNSAGEILKAISYWQLEVNRENAAGSATQAALNSGRFYIRASR